MVKNREAGIEGLWSSRNPHVADLSRRYWVDWAFSTDRAQKSMPPGDLSRITGTIGRSLNKLLILLEK